MSIGGGDGGGVGDDDSHDKNNDYVNNECANVSERACAAFLCANWAAEWVGAPISQTRSHMRHE